MDLISQFPGYLFYIDSNFIIRQCNNKLATLLGVDSSKIIEGHPLTDFISLEVMNQFKEELTRDSVHSGVRLVGLLLQDNQLYFEVQSIKDEFNQLTGYLCHAKAVEVNDDRLINMLTNPYVKEFINYLPENIFIIDKEHRMMLCNDNQAALFGLDSAEELIGLDAYEKGKLLNIDTEVVEEVMRNNQAVMDSMQARQYDEVGLANGKEVYTRVWKKPLINPETNESVGIVGISCNMATSSASKVDLKEVFDLLPSSTFWVNERNEILVCNKKQAEMFGLKTADELIGKNLYQVAELLGWPEKLADQLTAHNNLIMQKNKREIFEESFVDLNGKERFFLVYKNPVTNKIGAVNGVMGFSVEITERKELEKNLQIEKQKAEQASMAKSTFIMNVSHDLRTPCSNILGYSKNLLNSEKDPEKVDGLKALETSAESLMGLINATIETCKQIDSTDVNLAWFDLNVLLDTVLNQNLEKARKKKLKCTAEFDKLPVIKSDEILCKRIIFNILDNAIQFTERGSVSIDCHVQVLDNVTNLVIKISDTGVGIPDSLKYKIFDRFTKANVSYQDASEHHLGLGLYLANQAVDVLNGKIQLESQVGVGSCFTIVIPAEAKQVVDGPLSLKREPIKGSLESLNNKKCLLVEDSEIAGKLAKKILRDKGMSVIWAKTMQEALSEFDKTFDIVLVDIGLPDGNGLELAKKIKAICLKENLEPIPAFALTAHYQEDDSDAASGVEMVFLKPLDKCALVKLASYI